jgi:uncharacterized protein
MSEFINNASKERQEKIKTAIKRVHAGEPYESVKEEFAEVLRNATAQEISVIEQSLIAGGMPVEDIQYLCDVHVAMFRESLDEQPTADMLPGHPVYTFRTENELLTIVLNEIRNILRQLVGSQSAQLLERLKTNVEKMIDFDRHYERKENLLFSYLERVNFSGPSNVMWGIHNDIRKGWKQLSEVLAEKDTLEFSDVQTLNEIYTPIENMMREMIYKEEHILFPAALERLPEDDWLEMHAQEEEFGFSYVHRGDAWPENASKEAPKEEIIDMIEENKEIEMTSFPLNTGDLSISQLNMMLKRLPVDITYVDENDTVLYYSDTPERVFKRTAAIIGRKVQNCHPPQSMDKVQQILDDFKAGTRENAEFWIQMNGMFLHIEYFALRDADGNYKGTIEVSQDLTHLRELEGEKRLLDES